jgi:uncharacterized protein (TIGR03000 family)
MRCLSLTPTKGLLFAILALLLLPDGASAQAFRGRFRGRNPYYYSIPLTTSGDQQPMNNDVYTYPPTTYRSYYPPNAASLPATIELIVPADAQVWFDGVATSQTGTVRRFVTPPLNGDNNYSYEVKARWTKDGQPLEATRTITVVAGGFGRLDLTGAADAAR